MDSDFDKALKRNAKRKSTSLGLKLLFGFPALICLFTPPIGWVLLFPLYWLHQKMEKKIHKIDDESVR